MLGLNFHMNVTKGALHAPILLIVLTISSKTGKFSLVTCLNCTKKIKRTIIDLVN